MNYAAARGLLDLVALSTQGADSMRQRAVELLKEAESVIPRAESWLLADQYDESVVAPEHGLVDAEYENESAL